MTNGVTSDLVRADPGVFGLIGDSRRRLQKQIDVFPHSKRDPQISRFRPAVDGGHSAKKACGDYSDCRFEKGPFNILQIAADAAFAGLPREFRSMESHCGQIEWAPQALDAFGRRRGRRSDQGPVHPQERPAHLRSTVSYRNDRHSSLFAKDHGQLSGNRQAVGRVQPPGNAACRTRVGSDKAAVSRAVSRILPKASVTNVALPLAVSSATREVRMHGIRERRAL